MIHMRSATPFLSTMVILAVLVSSAILVDVRARQNIMCPTSQNTVNIDGKWTAANEWSDAFEGKLSFVTGTGEAYLRLKHDADSLYALVDCVSLKTPQKDDKAIVVVDTKNDGGEILQKDDFLLMCGYLSDRNAVTMLGWGTGTKELKDFGPGSWESPPKGFSAASTTDAQNNPYSKEGHAVWEFKIPKSEFKSGTIGFAAAVQSENNQNAAAYPLVNLNKPGLWAGLEFSSKTLTELTATTTSTSAVTPTKMTERVETTTVTKTTEAQSLGSYLVIGAVVAIGVVLAIVLVLRRKK